MKIINNRIIWVITEPQLITNSNKIYLSIIIFIMNHVYRSYQFNNPNVELLLYCWCTLRTMAFSNPHVNRPKGGQYLWNVLCLMTIDYYLLFYTLESSVIGHYRSVSWPGRLVTRCPRDDTDLVHYIVCPMRILK